MLSKARDSLVVGASGRYGKSRLGNSGSSLNISIHAQGARAAAFAGFLAAHRLSTLGPMTGKMSNESDIVVSRGCGATSDFDGHGPFNHGQH